MQILKFRCTAVTLIWSISLLAGCQDQSRGFALPPGNAETGKVLFSELGCNVCHAIPGVVDRRPGGDIFVQLGGQVTRVKTYGDLVTSIINPSHRLSRGNDPRTRTDEGASKMRRYNDVLTVQQLIDLTSFLSPQYSVWSPEYVAYRYF
jgi:hypothetical protein